MNKLVSLLERFIDEYIVFNCSSLSPFLNLKTIYMTVFLGIILKMYLELLISFTE